ncbi:MAG: hypothetical protein ACFFD4_21380, partial [Candidatus Odinarchaeota archaeon]
DSILIHCLNDPAFLKRCFTCLVYHILRTFLKERRRLIRGPKVSPSILGFLVLRSSHFRGYTVFAGTVFPVERVTL